MRLQLCQTCNFHFLAIVTFPNEFVTTVNNSRESNRARRSLSLVTLGSWSSCFASFVRLRTFVVQPCALLCGCVIRTLPFGRGGGIGRWDSQLECELAVGLFTAATRGFILPAVRCDASRATARW